MVISNHAYVRGKERLGLGKRAFDKIVNLALSKGVKHSQLSGKLKRYVDSIYFKTQRKGSNIVLYGEYLFIFQHSFLITVLNLPNDFKSYKKYIKK